MLNIILKADSIIVKWYCNNLNTKKGRRVLIKILQIDN